jgi:hypothetical protein
MTDISLPGSSFVEGDVRMGRVLTRSFAVLWRNFLTFSAVMAIVSLPTYVMYQVAVMPPYDRAWALQWSGAGIFLGLALTPLSQAIVLYAALQRMLGRPVDLGASIRVGLRRSLPILGVAFAVTLLGLLGLIALVVPGLIAFTRWFVAPSACVVDRLGVAASLRRSSELTSGHRWKIFGMLVVLIVAGLIAVSIIDWTCGRSYEGNLAFVVHVIWNGIWSALYTVFVVVLYHDLRVAKDGVETAEIAAVFD